MSITQALNTSLSGLQATQAGMSLIASNVANAQTPGYVRKTLEVATTTAGDAGSSVRVVGVNREIDQYLQTPAPGRDPPAAPTPTCARISIRGCRGSTATPAPVSRSKSVFNSFTGAVQSLVTSPDSTAARSLVLSNAQVLAQTLNTTTADIQSLRTDAEDGLADAVATANDAMQQIADLNAQLAGKDITNASDAALADQRDCYVDQLVEVDGHSGCHQQPEPDQRFHEFRHRAGGREGLAIGVQCPGHGQRDDVVGRRPAKSNLGTLLAGVAGGDVDRLDRQQLDPLRQDRRLLDMRDNVLVQAQNQLDGLAATMAQALSEHDCQRIAPARRAVLTVDTAGLLNGNRINLTYTDTATNTQHNVSIIRVDDPSVAAARQRRHRRSER